MILAPVPYMTTVAYGEYLLDLGYSGNVIPMLIKFNSAVSIGNAINGALLVIVVVAAIASLICWLCGVFD